MHYNAELFWLCLLNTGRRTQAVVVALEVMFGKATNGNMITIVHTIKKDIRLEFKFLDKNSLELI